jgi:hypothetical protein
MVVPPIRHVTCTMDRTYTFTYNTMVVVESPLGVTIHSPLVVSLGLQSVHHGLQNLFLVVFRLDRKL